MLKAVLFDFGGVFTPSPFSAITDAAPELGLTPQQILKLIFGDYAEDGDHPWHRLERGELTLAAAREELAALAKEAEVDVDVMALFGGWGRSTRSANRWSKGRGAFVNAAFALRW